MYPLWALRQYPRTRRFERLDARARARARRGPIPLDGARCVRWWVHEITSIASGAEDYHLFELELATAERVIAGDDHHGELRHRGMLPPAPSSLGTASSGLLWLCWMMFASGATVVALLIWCALSGLGDR